MTRLDATLHPGENLVLRNTDDRLVWYRAGILALFFCEIALSNFQNFAPRESEFWETVALLLTMPPLVLLWAWAGSIWLWVITDRRIVVREKPSSAPISLLLDTVEKAWIDGDTLHVHGGGRALELSVSDRFAAGGRLRGLLGDRFGDSGQQVASLDAILPTGEAVRLWSLPEYRIMNVAVPLALAFGAVGMAAQYIGWLRGPWAGGVGMAEIFIVLLLPDLISAWRRRGCWIAVTDRHLFLRRWHEPESYDRVAIEDIAHVEYDRKRARLIFHCGDRSLFLICMKWSARRILAALGREVEAFA